MREKSRSGRGKKHSATTNNLESGSSKVDEQPDPTPEKPPATTKQATQEDTHSATVGTQDDPGGAKETSAATQSYEESNIAKTTPQPQKSGGGAATTLATLALLLTLGLGGAGYYLWQQLQIGQQLITGKVQQSVTSSVGEIRSTLQEDQQKFTSIDKEITTLQNEISTLGKKQEELRTLQHDTTLQELAALNEGVTALKDNLDTADKHLVELQTGQQTVTDRIGEAESTLQKLAAVNKEITTLKENLDTASKGEQELQTLVQNSIDAVRTQAGRDLNAWKVAEAEYLMKIASRRLSLEHDITGAINALEAADSNLHETDDPRWLPVRKSISDTSAKLRTLPKPDIEGLAMALTTLGTTVDQLPLPQPARHLQSTALDTSTVSQSKDLQSWGNKVWEALNKLVVIRRGDKGATAALLPPDQSDYLRQNLHLKLESARYALLRNKPETFKESLHTAQQWVETHFETGAKATQTMLESLNKLQQIEFLQAVPDISTPLTQLRELRTRKLQPQQEAPDTAEEEGASS